jgi:hypothetical protein
MNCLTDYIGLRGCGSSAPASGFYINDLPGISLKQMVSLTNEEEKTYLDLWSMIQTRAQSRFSLDVREAMGKYYRMKSLIQGVNLGNQLGSINAAIPVPTNNRWGFTIELIESATYEYVPSPMASIHVQELRFYSDANASGIPFEIYDLNTGLRLFYKEVDLVSGWNTIPVNQTFSNGYAVNSWSVFCCIDYNNYADNFYDFDVPLNHTIPGCCNVRIRGCQADPYLNIGQDAIRNMVYTSNTYGLSGTFSIVCSWDAVVCQNKSLFTRPWWYLCGIELLTEQLYSSKLNHFTTVNLQRAKELREEYQVEYMKALEQIAGGFNLACDCCIECSGGVQLRETTSFY